MNAPTEHIKEITDVEDVEVPGDRYSSYDGIRLITTNQRILLAISNGQSCCENWGYFLSEDDPQKFVGAEFLGVRVVDTNLTGRDVRVGWEPGMSDDAISLDEGDVMFVNIQTDRGVLQFAAYNAHNGYYGHEAVIVQEVVVDTKSL